jgi:bifunctional UDP-N-acetylglucosamine pyrophosphorylase/glucosamine-1-phosphate N-acetyltransferase
MATLLAPRAGGRNAAKRSVMPPAFPRRRRAARSGRFPEAGGPMPVAVIVLAAGQGTRMNSDRPKVLHPLAGAPLLAHALAAARALDPARVVVVAGHEATAVAAATAELDPEAMVAIQAEQRGTADAVRAAAAALADFAGDVLVLYGDTPFVRPETLAAMLDARAAGAAVVALGFEAAEPGGYGRLVLGPDGGLDAIVEAKDATPAEAAIRLCNSGVIAADAALLFELLAEVRPDNAKGEYYLTDVVALARARGLAAAAIRCPEAETLGVNSRADLAAAEAAFQVRARSQALSNGATLTDPATVWFALDTVIGRDVEIGPNVAFGPGVTVESGATIRAFCHLEGCHVSRGAVVGPFARLRPGAELAEDVHVGNFVEIKNAIVDEGAKVNHLSYVGDARVGARANVGAGAITCNYDGVFKHRTEIGAGAFVGSNAALVAPVRIGARAVIAAGSVITGDVPDDALALARGRQTVKAGLGARMMARLRALKSKAPH